MLVVVVLGFGLYLRFKLRFKASKYLYISCSTKTMDRYPGLLQFTCLFSFHCIPCVMTRSPASLTVPVVYSSRDQVHSTPCVILIANHVIVYHVLLSATSKRPKSGKRVQCALHCFHKLTLYSHVLRRVRLVINENLSLSSWTLRRTC